MTSIGVLLGLLVLSYVGSILVAGRTIRGFGLPSGAEYVVLGVVIGPHVLGLLQESVIKDFEPIVLVGVSWVAFLAGLSYRHVGRRAVKPGRALLGAVFALAIAGAVFAAGQALLDALGWGTSSDRFSLSLAGAMVLSESTRHTVRWVAERHGARGPLSDWIADVARASAIVPVIILAFLLVLLPHEGVHLPIGARLGATFGIGAVLGVVAAVLLGREFRQNESWGILIGTTLLAMGVAVRLGLSPLSACFFLGLTLSILSRHQEDIRALAQRTEKPVALPVLLLAGTHLDFAILRQLLPWIVAALFTRFVCELARGFLVSSTVKVARPAGTQLGLGFISIGPISIAVALAYAVRAPGILSAGAVNLAILGAILGEVLGPAALRRALEGAGETEVIPSGGDENNPLASIPPPPFSDPHAGSASQEHP